MLLLGMMSVCCVSAVPYNPNKSIKFCMWDHILGLISFFSKFGVQYLPYDKTKNPDFSQYWLKIC